MRLLSTRQWDCQFLGELKLEMTCWRSSISTNVVLHRGLQLQPKGWAVVLAGAEVESKKLGRVRMQVALPDIQRWLQVDARITSKD